MKPLTIKVKTLIKIGMGVAIFDFAVDLGKAVMFKAFKVKSPEEADKMMDTMNAAIDSEELSFYKKIKLKTVRGLCKLITEE